MEDSIACLYIYGKIGDAGEKKGQMLEQTLWVGEKEYDPSNKSKD